MDRTHLTWSRTFDESIYNSASACESTSILTRTPENAPREYALCVDVEDTLDEYLQTHDEHVEELVLTHRPCVLHFCVTHDDANIDTDGSESPVPECVHDIIRQCKTQWDKTNPTHGYAFEMTDAAIFKCRAFYSVVIASVKFPTCFDMCAFLQHIESARLVRKHFTRSTYKGAYRWPLLGQSSSTTLHNPLKPANRSTRAYGASSSFVTPWFEFARV